MTKGMDKIYRKIADKALDADVVRQIEMTSLERSLLYELMHTRVKLEFRTWISRLALTLAGGMAVFLYTHLN